MNGIPRRLRAAFCAILGLAAVAETAANAATSAKQAATYALRVDGLACPFCVYGLEKKLHSLADVERVETNLEDGIVLVVLREGAVLEEAAARQAVRDAGFRLDGFERVAPGRGP